MPGASAVGDQGTNDLLASDVLRVLTKFKVGIVGLGGLGHMGVKFADAFGAHVVLFTTSPGKTQDARRLGADEVSYRRTPTR